MVSIKTIISTLAILSLFFGILSGISYDILMIIAKPTDVETWKTLVVDFAKIVMNSQVEIKEAVEELKNVENVQYGNYLISRIIAGSLVSLFMIWLIYKVFRFFVESPSVSDKILIILMSVFLVYLIGVIASYILGKPNFQPYPGFASLIENRDVVINYVLNQYR